MSFRSRGPTFGIPSEGCNWLQGPNHVNARCTGMRMRCWPRWCRDSNGRNKPQAPGSETARLAYNPLHPCFASARVGHLRDESGYTPPRNHLPEKRHRCYLWWRLSAAESIPDSGNSNSWQPSLTNNMKEWNSSFCNLSYTGPSENSGRSEGSGCRCCYGQKTRHSGVARKDNSSTPHALRTPAWFTSRRCGGAAPVGGGGTSVP